MTLFVLTVLRIVLARIGRFVLSVRLRLYARFDLCRSPSSDRRSLKNLAAVRLRMALSRTAGVRALVLTLLAVRLRRGHRHDPSDVLLPLQRLIGQAGGMPIF